MSFLGKSLAVLGLLFLMGCGGSSPFIETQTGDDTTTPDDEDTVADPDLPPGTSNPRAGASIERFEPTEADGGIRGDGFATDFERNDTDDVFTVDNLAFDGANTYRRIAFDAASDIPDDFQAYQSDGTFTDTFGDTDQDIDQFEHRLIFRRSEDGNVQYAIVRTGQYIQYGFGGFTYERRGRVRLPTNGQAGYSGSYQAVRDFEGAGGLEYATGDMTMAIDFEDFNDGDGVQGRVTNRRIFDIDGNDITADVVAALESDIPSLVFSVGPGVGTDAGEIVGDVSSNILQEDGSFEAFESGSYYAILQGDDAENVVGVIVSTHTDPRAEGVTVRETGGFILERGAGD